MANIVISAPSCAFWTIFVGFLVTDHSPFILIECLKFAGIIMLIQKVPDPKDPLLHVGVSQSWRQQESFSDKRKMSTVVFTQEAD